MVWYTSFPWELTVNPVQATVFGSTHIHTNLIRFPDSPQSGPLLSSAKVSACIVTTIQMALTNSSLWSQFPLNGSGSAALALQIRLCKVWAGMLAWEFIAIACATADAVVEATLVMSSHVSATRIWRKAFNSLSCCSCSCWPSKSDCRNGLF